MSNLKQLNDDENISDALTGAALAICNVLSPRSTNTESETNCLSPSLAVSLRMKNYEQLKAVE